MYVMLAMTVLSMIATVVLKVNYKEKQKEGEKSQILKSEPSSEMWEFLFLYKRP